MWLTESYDQQTRALTDIQTILPQSPTVTDDISYAYSKPGVSKGAGLLVSTTDKQNGGATVDTQCFSYDDAQRLSQA